MISADKIDELEGSAPPAELRAVLVPAVPIAVEAAVAAIRNRGPYPDISENALDRNLRIGLTDAVERWFDTPAAGEHNDLHFALGRAQARAGRSLDELMGFYRIAALTMWRRLAEIGAERGVEPKQLYRLAETGFGCVDELSTQAAAGYADEQSHRSGAAHSRRTELVQLLLRSPQPTLESLQSAARAVGIELAPTLAFFVGPAERYDAFARSVRDPVVLGPREGEFIGAILDPDGPRRLHALSLAAERADVQLALGPPVQISRASSSLTRARALRVLLLAGLVRSAPLVTAADHEVALLLSAEPELALELAEQRLAPLDAVHGEITRANLRATLGAWLAHPGQRKTIAHSLGVHPQTVRYRMTRLRELFGTTLDDPEGRFELQLALRVGPYARLAAGAESPGPASAE